MGAKLRWRANLREECTQPVEPFFWRTRERLDLHESSKIFVEHALYVEIAPYNLNALENSMVMRIEYMIKEDESN